MDHDGNAECSGNCVHRDIVMGWADPASREQIVVPHPQPVHRLRDGAYLQREQAGDDQAEAYASEATKQRLSTVKLAAPRGSITDRRGAIRSWNQGARAITRHLIELGHRDIGFITGDPKHTPTALRASAFFDTMAEAGLTVPDARVAEGLFTYRSGLLAASALLQSSPRPTAIICSNDDMAAAAVAVAHGLGLRVPEDLSVTGFDDTPVATTIWPELTTIHQPVATMTSIVVSRVNSSTPPISGSKTRSGGMPTSSRPMR